MKVQIQVRILISAFLGMMVEAGTEIYGPDGERFFVGDWSVPELVEVNSAAGPAKLLRKTCEVCLQRAGRETRYKFDVLWDPDKPTVWAGERRPFYYLLGQTICGSSIEGWHLVVKRSRTVDRFGDLTFEGYIQTELAKFVADPSAAKGPLNADAVFTLDKIFTFNSILPSRSATTHSPFVTVTDLRVDPQGVTFAMKTKVGKKLTLTLDANLELVSATCDNVPVLVLMTRTGSSWAGPTQITVPSENGNITVLSCNWAVVEKADNGDEIEKEAFRAVVAPDTGAVWIGPLFCVLSGSRFTRIPPRCAFTRAERRRSKSAGIQRARLLLSWPGSRLSTSQDSLSQMPLTSWQNYCAIHLPKNELLNQASARFRAAQRVQWQS